MTKIYWLHQYPNAARLGIMARPRGNDWLDGEIASLQRQDVRVVVSLLETSEIRELELMQEEFLCESHGISYINFPVTDRGTPGKPIDNIIAQLRRSLNEGASIVIHCRMGIGRSSILAGALLLTKDKKAIEVLKHISTVRGLTVPDTKEQIAWLQQQENLTS